MAELDKSYFESVLQYCTSLEACLRARELDTSFLSIVSEDTQSRLQGLQAVQHQKKEEGDGKWKDTFKRQRRWQERKNLQSLQEQVILLASSLKALGAVLGEQVGESDDEDVERERERSDIAVVWGEQMSDKDPRVVQDKQRIISVACNGQRGLYVTNAGDVFSIGDDGTGVPQSVENAKPKVIGELVLERVLLGRKVVLVACGHLHSCALTQGGRLWSWGCGQYGRLGHGDESDQPVPRLCEALLQWHVRAVACGGAHTVAVVSPSRVFSWGLGRHGRLGLGDKKETSHALPQLVNVDDHAHAVKDAYHAFFGSKLPQAAQRLVDEPIVSVSTGWAFTLLLGANGTVRAFGAGTDGQCGLSVPRNQPKPAPVPGLSNRGVIQISCGYHHAIAVTSDGKIFTWGMGEEGQLGHGASQRTCLTPQQVCFPAGTQAPHVVSAVAGQFHSLCAEEGGWLWGWGSNLHWAIDPSLPREILWEPVKVLEPGSGWSKQEEGSKNAKKDSIIKLLGAGDHFTIAVRGPRRHLSKALEEETEARTSYQHDLSGLHTILSPDADLKRDNMNQCNSSRELRAAAALLPQINTGSFCGGRIGFWTNGRYIPRIGVLTSTGALELYKELISAAPDQVISIYGHNVEVLNKGNVLEAWKTMPGQEYTLLLRLRLNSHVEAVAWAKHLSQHAPGDHQMQYVPNKDLSIARSDLATGSRRLAWRSAIGNQLRITPELYMIYKERATRQEGIGLDVKRTLPTLLLFGKPGEPLYDQLREVLEVYQIYRPDVGYVQGMSYIAAMLCLHVPNDPYECFVCLANLLVSHHLFDFFRLGQAYNKVQRYYQVLDETIHKTSPRLWHHLLRLGVMNEVHLACFQWLQTMFVRRLPLEQVTRLWDALLCGKDTSVMIRACVGLLLCVERSILSVSQPEDVLLLLRSAHQLKNTVRNTFSVVQVPYSAHEKLRGLVLQAGS